MKNSVLILDFGSQYTKLIARRVRELQVYSEIAPFSMGMDKIKAMAPGAIILSGGPSSVYEKNFAMPILKSVILFVSRCEPQACRDHGVGQKV